MKSKEKIATQRNWSSHPLECWYNFGRRCAIARPLRTEPMILWLSLLILIEILIMQLRERGVRAGRVHLPPLYWSTSTVQCKEETLNSGTVSEKSRQASDMAVGFVVWYLWLSAPSMIPGNVGPPGWKGTRIIVFSGSCESASLSWLCLGLSGGGSRHGFQWTAVNRKYEESSWRLGQQIGK